ncbi:hypothetical protein D3C83_159700 [compost metagenome]
MTSRFLSDRDDLDRHDVHVARLHRTDVIGETEALSSHHSGEVEAPDLAKAGAVARVCSGVVNDYVVAL